MSQNNQSIRSNPLNSSNGPNSKSTKNTYFITFEGGEGAGKSTQIERLANSLKKIGISSITTREPGGTPKAELIREFILSGDAKKFGPTTEAMLFAAARLNHVDLVIKPALETGNWVLCDRFTDSTLVYQGEDGVKKEVLLALEEIAVGKTVPDLTIIIDIEAHYGLMRSNGHNQSKQKSIPDRFERETIEVHEKRRQAFLKLAKSDSNRYAVVDGSKNIDDVEKQIWQLIRPLTQ